MSTPEAVEPPNLPTPPAGPDAHLRPSRLQSVRTALRMLRVRLRFVAVLAVAFLVVGKWDALRSYRDALWHALRGAQTAPQAVSSDTEYFCPMDPGVLSDWPGKCSICNMTLVRRKRGDVVALPGGVVARMQVSPYRVQLAGVQTSPVAYRPLAREVTCVGHVRLDGRQVESVTSTTAGVVAGLSPLDEWAKVREGDVLMNVRPEVGDRAKTIPVRSPVTARLIRFRVEKGQPIAADSVVAEVAGLSTVLARTSVRESDLLLVREGAAVEATTDALPGHEPFRGRVRAVRPDGDGFLAEIELANPDGSLWPGMGVVLRIWTPIDQIEPFRTMPSDPPPIRKGEPRAVHACPDHPETLHEKSGTCPIDGKALERRELAEHQRVGWWCPMHPDVTADRPGERCRACGGMVLVPRVVTYRPQGQVLAVPESAVVDTGAKTVVYVESGPGMFDGVEVTLGPRCGESYPVIRGLEAGQRVATTGAFLIDAETRLNPALAAGYFGAGRGGATAPTIPVARPETEAASVLSPADRALAARQKTCPVTGKPLGSMGTPVKLDIAGRTVFVCCAGCETPLRKDPARYLTDAKR